MMPPKRLVSDKRCNAERLWLQSRGTRRTMLAIVLSALAMTTAVVDASFVSTQTQRQRQITRKINIGRSPLETPSDLSPLPTFTSLGYEHDKSFEANIDIKSTQQQQQRKTLSASPTSSDEKPPGNGSSVSKATKQAISQLVNIRYRGNWYDVTKWRRAHPAGAHWLDWFNGRDASEIIDALHGTHSRMMTTRLPKAKHEIAVELEAKAAPDSTVQLNFRKLFDKMLQDGWWKRDKLFEIKQLGIWASLFFGAIATIKRAPFVSFVMLSLSFTGAGWLGHDYVHGLDGFAKRLRLFLPLTTGISPRMWSDKHNKHHALTNEIGVDEDMATDPILYTSPPDPSHDSVFRKMQHYVFWIPFSFLFFVWRFDSIIAAVHAVDLKRPAAKPELYSILGHYALLFAIFPANIWLPSFLLSGLITAFVVTSTHQSEEKFTDYQSDHVTRQFMCTRSVVMSNPFSAWVWGGMQYQIEHHLFPSIPRSKLPLLKPIIQKFAEDNNIPGGYRESGEYEILKMNWDTYRAAAKASPVVGAPPSSGRPGQQAAIAEGFTAACPFHKVKP